MKQHPVESLLHPESIALMGATNNPTKMGMLPCLSILQGGFKGRFYPVSRKEEAVLGAQAYPSVTELPETPDLGIIIIPTQYVIDAVAEFGRKGTKNLVIVSSGFREAGDDDLEGKLNQTAEEYGIRFIGPNCLGIINTDISLNTSGISVDNSPGPLGFLSHSGTYVAQTAAYREKHGIRFSKAISLGNGTNVGMTEALEYLGEDRQTKAVALYMEGIGDGKEFIEVARRVSEKKPVIAHYAGGSSVGARSGSSHTGAMAGPDHLYEGIFRQAGIIRVHSIEDLYMHGMALATQPPLRGKRIAVVTNSGGPGTSMANHLSQEGLDVPEFSPGLKKDIRQHIFEYASGSNPVDITFTLDMNILTTKIPELIVDHDEADGFVLHGAFLSGMLKAVYPGLREVMNVPLEALLANFDFNPEEGIAFPWRHGTPLVLSSFFGKEDNYTEAYMEAGIPVFDGPEKAASAMATLWKRKEITERRKSAGYRLPEAEPEATEIIENARSQGRRTLDEYEAKRVLALYRVPVTEEELAVSEEDAVQAAERIGYPLALKACSPDILHKTEKGLVHLNVENENNVRHAFTEIQNGAKENVPVLIQRMLSGKRECVAGMKRFPGFGPAVLFGLGGIYTELINDSTLRVAPFTREDGLEMLNELRTSAMLEEFRGMPAVDRDAMVSLLQSVGFLAHLHPEISEMDLNPIILEGAKPVVADALIVLST